MDEDGRKRVLLAHLADLTNIVASESDEKSPKGEKDIEICVARIGALVGESPKMVSEDWWHDAVKRLMDAVAARLRRQDRVSPESDRTGKIWLKFVEALPKRDVPPRDPPEWFVSELRDIYAEFCPGDDIDAELPREALVRIRDLMAKANASDDMPCKARCDDPKGVLALADLASSLKQSGKGNKKTPTKNE